MEEKFCQSCGMPMGGPGAEYGAEKDGSKSPDYCSYCYENGAFTFGGTMAEMIDLCVPPMVESNQGMTAQAAREMMGKFFPMLKRWSTK